MKRLLFLLVTMALFAMEPTQDNPELSLRTGIITTPITTETLYQRLVMLRNEVAALQREKNFFKGQIQQYTEFRQKQEKCNTTFCKEIKTLRHDIFYLALGTFTFGCLTTICLYRSNTRHNS